MQDIAQLLGSRECHRQGGGKGLLTEAHSRAFIVILEALNITEDQGAASRALGSTLELALRTGLPLATLDADLAKAAKKAGGRAFEYV